MKSERSPGGITANESQEGQNMVTHRTPHHGTRTAKGVTLIELMVVLAIFSIVMAGLYSAYSAQMKVGVKEYKLAESEMEFQIGKMVLGRDLFMAGYGIADDYSSVTPSFTPRVAEATDGNPDTLTMVGTALGRESRATQAWSYTMVTGPTLTTHFYPFSFPTVSFLNSQENLWQDDRIVYMNVTSRKLLGLGAGTNSVTGKSWLFQYPPQGTDPTPGPLDTGVVAYGLQAASAGSFADFPYYIVDYRLGTTGSLSSCAPGSQNLLRSENNRIGSPNPGQPLFSCVLDFQVVFGIDTTEDGLIDCWDNGGQTEAQGYLVEVLRQRVKQIKVYILVQQGKKDPAYTASGPIRVGDATLNACGGGGVGRDVTLLATQSNYRWRVIALSVVPRNLR